MTSPVVEKAELRRALEDFLPSVNVAMVQAELRRLVADPRFHGRRLDELRVVRASFATMVLTAYLGAQAVCDLIFGWIRMVRELDHASTFDQVRAAGERYGELVGAQTARILVLLATAAIAEGGVITRLMKLPRASQASAALATETGGIGLAVAGTVKGARVVQSGVEVTLGVAAKGAVVVAMAARGPTPAGGSPGLRAFTASNFRENLARLTGGIPEGADAHHVFPQKLADKFKEAGLNIHDPRYGAWWETKAHQQAGFAYNERWERFMEVNRSAEEILQFGRAITADHGLRVGF